MIDAVGLEAHGSAGAELARKAVSVLPDRIAEPLSEKAGVDRLSALRDCIDTVRRCATSRSSASTAAPPTRRP